MSREPHTDVTSLLQRAGAGDSSALAELTPVIYDELRAIAHGALRQRSPGQTLRTTALVNEAYLKLVDQTQAAYENRGHFFGVAAKAMRSILVDYARLRGAAKRGGDRTRVPFEDAMAAFDDRQIDLEALDQALSRLDAMDERKGRVVELRFFGGLTIEQTADVLGISHATVERDWDFAKAWLFRELNDGMTG